MFVVYFVSSSSSSFSSGKFRRWRSSQRKESPPATRSDQLAASIQSRNLKQMDRRKPRWQFSGCRYFLQLHLRSALFQTRGRIFLSKFMKRRRCWVLSALLLFTETSDHWSILDRQQNNASQTDGNRENYSLFSRLAKLSMVVSRIWDRNANYEKQIPAQVSRYVYVSSNFKIVSSRFFAANGAWMHFIQNVVQPLERTGSLRSRSSMTRLQRRYAAPKCGIKYWNPAQNKRWKETLKTTCYEKFLSYDREKHFGENEENEETERAPHGKLWKAGTPKSISRTMERSRKIVLLESCRGRDLTGFLQKVLEAFSDRGEA